MLAERRSDVEIKAVEVNKRGKKEIVLVNPAGMDCGELFLIDGRLQIRNPNEATLSWMLTIADELGGRVVDNTAKTYRNPRETYVHPDDLEARKRLSAAIRKAREIDRQRVFPKRNWWIWWMCIIVIGGLYFLLSK